MTDSDTPDTLDITVYGAYWCPDCHRAKQFLGEHQIPYHWVDIEEDPEGERFVIEANEGKRRIPTLVFGDGSVLSNPTNAELAARLGMKTTAERLSHDNGSEYSALALLLATGSKYRRLGVPGEEDYLGAGVHFCATCDGPFYKTAAPSRRSSAPTSPATSPPATCARRAPSR